MFVPCNLLEPIDAGWMVDQVVAGREPALVGGKLSRWPRRRQRALTVLDAIRAEAVLRGCQTDLVCGDGRSKRWRLLSIRPESDEPGGPTGVREPRRPRPSDPARQAALDPRWAT